MHHVKKLDSVSPFDMAHCYNKDKIHSLQPKKIALYRMPL